MIVVSLIFLILFVPLLLHGAPTPANDGNHPSGQFNWPQSSNLLHILNPPDSNSELAPGLTHGGNLNPRPGIQLAPGQETNLVHSDLGPAPAHAGTHSENLGSHSLLPLGQVLDGSHVSIPYKPLPGWKHHAKMQFYLPPRKRTVTFGAELQLEDSDPTRFLDFTRHFIGTESNCELPLGTWYRTLNKGLTSQKVTLKASQTLVRVDMIAVTPQGFLVLIPRYTRIAISKSRDHKVHVHSDMNIRVVSVPYAAQDWIWDVCLSYYHQHHSEIERDYASDQYMIQCFHMNMWGIGRPFSGNPEDWRWYTWNAISESKSI